MYILNTAKIREFAEAVLCLPGTMVTGEPDPDQVKVLLGELLDIWPASIFPGLGEGEDRESSAHPPSRGYNVPRAILPEFGEW